MLGMIGDAVLGVACERINSDALGGQAWKFCIFWERRSEPKKIQEPKKTKKKEMKRGERERKEKRGERE